MVRLPGAEVQKVDRTVEESVRKVSARMKGVQDGGETLALKERQEAQLEVAKLHMVTWRVRTKKDYINSC